MNGEGMYTEDEIKMIARTKEVLIKTNNLCCMYKDLYYNHDTIAISDYEYDVLEHRVKHLAEISGIDISKDVKFNILTNAGYPVNDIEVDVKALTKDSAAAYETATKLLMDTTGWWVRRMVYELKELCAKYNVTEEDLKALGESHINKRYDIQDIKRIAIECNNLCIDLKIMYYNYSTNAIADYEYDHFEDDLCTVLKATCDEIDIRDDVKYIAPITVGIPLEEGIDEYYNLNRHISNAQKTYNKLRPILTAVMSQVISELKEKGKELPEYLYNEDLKEREIK